MHFYSQSMARCRKLLTTQAIRSFQLRSVALNTVINLPLAKRSKPSSVVTCRDRLTVPWVSHWGVDHHTFVCADNHGQWMILFKELLDQNQQNHSWQTTNIHLRSSKSIFCSYVFYTSGCFPYIQRYPSRHFADFRLQLQPPPDPGQTSQFGQCHQDPVSR